MAEKVAKLGLVMDSGFDYHLDSGAIWRVPREEGVLPFGAPEKVQDVDVQEDAGYRYFVDEDGDVSRERRTEALDIGGADPTSLA